MSFEFSALPYDYSALEPHIDATTMEIHHGRHHKTYFDKFTAAIAGTAAEGQSLEQIMASVSTHGAAVRNNGGGFYNHNFFFACLSPNGGGTPSGDLGAAINSAFGSFDNLKSEMEAAGAARFGSGFVWLVVNAGGKLQVCSTPNQDNPLMDIAEVSGTPILAIDVWEHAYYLKYQNKRPEYLSAIWNVINWEYAAQAFAAAQ